MLLLTIFTSKMANVLFKLCPFCTVGKNGEVTCSAPPEASPPITLTPKCKNFANCKKNAYVDPKTGKVHDLCRRKCLDLNKPIVLQCLASGCLENHSRHFCKVCKNDNSDHKSADCPQKTCNVCSMERKFHIGIDNLCPGRKYVSFK